MYATNALKNVRAKSIAFTSVFIALSVIAPAALHVIAGPAAGKLFLPMQLFVFVAALLLGWQIGVITGISSSLISFSITGMPALEILPIIAIELALYGFITGYLFRTKKQNIFLSLLGAMVIGRLALLAIIYILPVKISATNYIFSATKAGVIGIAIQLILIPLIYSSLKKYIPDERI